MTSFLDYTVLDLETTGLDPKTNDIIEIAIMKVRNGEIGERFSTFVYTPLEVTDHVQYLTGIHANDLQGKPDFITLMPKIQAFIGDDALLGHNIRFDVDFLAEKGVDVQKNLLYDTYLLSNILYPELPSHSLETNTKYFGIPHKDSHRAMADVEATHALWKRLIASFPELSDNQRRQIAFLKEKSHWPLLDFFLQDRKPSHEALPLNEMTIFHPEKLSACSLRESSPCMVILSRGLDPVDAAKSLNFHEKTLFVGAHDYTLEKLNTVFPDAALLLSPSDYLAPEKVEQVKKRKHLIEAEAMLLLKTIVYPGRVLRDEFRLSHPERKIWNNCSIEEKEETGFLNPYQEAYQKAISSEKAITTHWQLLKNPELRKHFNQVVIVEPHLLEDNATFVYGHRFSEESFLLQSSSAEWQKAGQEFFQDVRDLGEILVPSALYPEHMVLSRNIVESHEFLSLKRKVENMLSDEAFMEHKASLQTLESFFHYEDPSWVRWFTVDPKKHETTLHMAPLSIKTLLKKNLFDDVSVILISQTGKAFSFLPDHTVIHEASRPLSVTPILPPVSRIRGARKDGDHSAILGYLAEEIPKMSGHIGVIFSSKAVLRRYFFDLITVLPEEILMLGEDLSGGAGKFRDRYQSSVAKTKVLFLTYRNLGVFSPELLSFSTIFLVSLPFDPPGLPIHQARQMAVRNAFVDYALPRAKENLQLILTTFDRQTQEKRFVILDRRVQEQNYGEEFLGTL